MKSFTKWFRWQNLAKEEREEAAAAGNKYRGHWISARGWIDWFGSNDKQISWEVCTGPGLGLSLQSDPSESEVTLIIRPLFFTVYLIFGRLFPESFYPNDPKHKYEAKYINFHIHSWGLWLDLWTPLDSWEQGQRSYSFDIKDNLMGRMERKEIVLKKTTLNIPFPEGNYPVEMTLKQATYSRPRKPWVEEKYEVTVNADKAGGIPVPGKGESSYDCGDTAVMEASYNCYGFSDAIREFQATVRRKRERYGSGNDMYVGKEEEVKADEVEPDPGVQENQGTAFDVSCDGSCGCVCH